MEAKKQARQGDVLITKIDKVERHGNKVEREAGRIVLAHGEATGHAHAISSAAANLYEMTGGLADPSQRILSARELVELRHEEHSEIILPAGNWEIRRQKEYEPGAIRNVAD